MNVTILKGKHYQFSLVRLWHRFIPFGFRRNKVISFFVLESRRRIRLYIYVNDEKVNYDGYFHTWNNTKVRFPSLILPWHGGKDNDGNGIGGVAPVDIDIELDINKNS